MGDSYPDLLSRRGIDLDTLVLDPRGTLLAPGALGATPELPSLEGTGLETWALTIGRTIGQGGMGIVREGTQVALDRRVAVKGIRPDKDVDEYRRHLYLEAYVTGRLEHPNIVPVYALGADEAGRPAFVMRHLGGVRWSDLLSSPADYPELMIDRDPLDVHLTILEQVCRAVHFAHAKGILHRDLKPSNVMLGEFGEVYVLDWGLAVSTRDDHAPLRHARDVVTVEGTPAFMAPEMSIGDGERISVASDVFLLGAILHRILSGENRYGGSTVMSKLAQAYECLPPDYGEDVPADLGRIAIQAMARDPEARFESAEELRRAIAAHREHRLSAQLTEQADERVRGLANPVLAPVEVATRAAEARFGFQQALRAWPENTAAVNGLNRLIVTMVRWSIDLEDIGAASLWLGLHPAPPPALTHDVEALRQRLETEASRLEALKRDADVRVGARARAVASWVVGLTWMAGTWLVGASESWFGQPRGNEGLVVVEVIVLIAIAAMMRDSWPRQLSRSGRNQSILSFIMAFGVFVVTLSAWVLGLTVVETVGIISVHLAVSAAALALISVPAVAWCVPLFALAMLGVILWPAGVWFIAGISGMLGFAVMGWVWRRAAEELARSSRYRS